MPEITLPFHFTPRPYQLPFFQAMDSGIKRAVLVLHRRSGKEKSCLNYCIKEMFRRVGTYYYLFPTYGQAKRVLWDGRDKDGFRFLDHFPADLIAGKPNETELKIKLINGSIFQLIGTDNIDSIVGANPIGCVFSEYALQNPAAWDYLRPILLENDGWAIFNFTPRGKNHAYQLFQMALKNPDWYVLRLSISDTGVISTDQIEAERRSGMDEEVIQQEYFCSFEGAQQGAYYGRQMEQAEKDKRIGNVRYQPEFPVDTWWDLGINDAMALWFTQTVGREIHVIDYEEHNGEGLPYYAKMLQSRGYVYGTHNAPHDIQVRELGSGKSRLETAAALGIKFNIVPNIGIADGIDAARAFLSRCWFDSERTAKGRNALVSYHKTWDDKRKCFSSAPYHDWSSNGSDAFRYLAVGHKITQSQRVNAGGGRPMQVSTSNTSWLGV